MGYLRHPKTTQEKRKNQDCEYCRPARRPHNLPDAWEDYSKNDDRCWKSYRKSQYKTKTFPKKKKDSSSYSESVKNKDHWHLNHRCFWCFSFSRKKCNGCENRELNRREYEERETKRIRAQFVLEEQERNRQWNKDYFEWKYGDKETTT